MSSTPDRHTPRPVFLSYASQDAEAARRVSEALRAVGVEVWFDVDGGLEHGDEWDAKIRRQVKECALFVPLISANTQAREEGYFRLEWDMAAERARTIASGVAFILPIVIDDTREGEALVPERFLAVQWTRLPDGNMPREVAERFAQLWQQRVGLATRGAASTARKSSSQPWSRVPVDPARPQVPDYELIRKIGQGGYGEVWLGRGLTGVYRAIKVVWRDRFDDPAPYEREFSGLKRTMALPDASQLGLLHVGQNEVGGYFYYVMELADDAVTGRTVDPENYTPLTLREVRQRRGRLPASECVRIGIALTRSLASLHERGLVHRDIKPSNVILVGGVPKLSDIGLVTTAGDSLTYVGTQGFVPPEGPGRAGADVFAVGRLLYELATGLDREEFPRVPPDLGKGAERRLWFRLNDVILRACDEQPVKRHANAAELQRDLEQLIRPSSGRSLVWVGAAATVALSAAVFGWLHFRPSATKPAESLPGAEPVPDVSSVMAPKLAAPQVAEKSIAVLPFANLSSDPANAFFADGVHEDVLAKLNSIPELRVVSRTTVMSYRDTKKAAKEIGRELSVAYLLEGSVRREGAQVRLTGQLVEVRTDRPVRSFNYTRSLSDIFALQADLAQTIAGELNAVLSVETKADLERPMTANLAAYEEYLKGVAIGRTGSSTENSRKAEQAFQRAVELDPGFAAAWGALAEAHSSLVFQTTDTSPERKARADEAMAQALRLAPESVDTLRSHGIYIYQRFRDYNRATEIFEKLRRRLPNDASVYHWLGAIQRRNLQWPESVANLRRAVELEPSNLTYSNTLGQSLSGLRRAEECYAESYRRIALLQGDPASAVRFNLSVSFRFDVKREQLDRGLLALPPEQFNHPDVVFMRRTRAFERRDLALYRQLDEQLQRANEGREAGDVQAALEYAVLGDPVAAQKRLGKSPERARAAVEKNPESPFSWITVGLIEAVRGNRQEALRAARKAAELMPERLDPYFGPQGSRQVAEIMAWCGEKDWAIAELRRLARNPSSYVAAGGLAHSVRVAPLWNHPEFASLLDEVIRYTPLTGEVNADMLREHPLPTTLREPVGVPFTLPGTVAAPVAAPVAPANALAVLPFANLSGDPAQDYFSDGLTEEILQTLAREPALRVAGRSSAFFFKGRNASLAEVARALNVAQIVEGSVRRAGNRVRIVVQLTRTSDGYSEALGTFDREVTDIFALQDEVARAVAAKLTGRGLSQSVAVATRNAEAYDLYLRGRALQVRSGNYAQEAGNLFEQAVQLDPEFALAWVRLAEARFRAYRGMTNRSPRITTDTWAALSRALAINPNLPEALMLRAEWARLVELDLAGAANYLARAETAGASSGELRFLQAQLARETGDWERATQLARDALALDPQNGDAINAVALGIFVPAGKFAEADALYARAMEIQGPQLLFPYRNRVILRAAWRGPAAALRLAERAPAGQVGADFVRAAFLIQLGRLAEARALIESADHRVGSGAVGSTAAMSGRNDAPASLLIDAGMSEAARERAIETKRDAEAQVAAGNPAPLVLNELVMCEIILGNRSEALRLLRDWSVTAAAFGRVRRITEYGQFAAQLYSRLGEAKEATAILGEMRDLGIQPVFSMNPSARFDFIASDPTYQQLAKQAAQHAAAQPDPLDDPLATAAALSPSAAITPAAGTTSAVPTFTLPQVGREAVSATPTAQAEKVSAGSPRETLNPSGNELSIAVLPFVNVSGDKEQEYFADGISEELLITLTKAPGLRVVARTSAFAFKGKGLPVTEMARYLGVAYVVEGSVRRGGDRVRIGAQLVRASDGFQIWAESFDRELRDVLTVQSEIAALVSRALQVKLALKPAQQVNDSGFNSLLKARHFAQRENVEGWRRAVASYRAALAADPNSAVAWGELARTYTLLARYEEVPPAESFREARQAARRALQLDPELAVAHAALGLVYRTADWDWNAAAASMDRALAQNSGDARILSDAALVQWSLGRRERAIELLRTAVALDPLNAGAHGFLGMLLASEGTWAGDRAIERAGEAELRRAIELAPNASTTPAVLACLLVRMGELDRAEQVLASEPDESNRYVARALLAAARANATEARRLRTEMEKRFGATTATYSAQISSVLRDFDHAFEWLEKALAARVSSLAWIKSDPYLKPLHSDPRWDSLLGRLGLNDSALAAVGSGAPAVLTPTARAEPAPASTPTPTATLSEGEKSIAVLPLESFSAAAEDALFTDGMHAEIIATLSRVPGLRVISRNSMLRYRSPQLSLAEIGRELGVANIVTGNVRRAGAKVRIQLELRRAGDEALLWTSPKVEKEFADIWSLQDEMAEQVALALQVRTSSGWFAGAQSMTKNAEAYRLFLEAREIPRLRGPSRDAMRDQASLCEQALKLDDRFVAAAQLATQAYAYWFIGEPEAEERARLKERAKFWAERTAKLMPGGAGDGGLVVYYGMVEGNEAEAFRYAQNEARALPNDSNTHNRMAIAMVRQGRFAEAELWFNRMLSVDPLHVRGLHNRVSFYGAWRRLEQFEAAAARSKEVGGQNVDTGLIWEFRARLTGKFPSPDEQVQGVFNPPQRLNLSFWQRDYAAVVNWVDQALVDGHLGVRSGLAQTFRLRALDYLGRREERRAGALALLGANAADPRVLGSDTSWALALADREQEAIAEAKRRIDELSDITATLQRWAHEAQLAEIYAWFGRGRESCELLGKLLRVPSGVTVPFLELSPAWDRIRDSAEFKALVGNPINRAPL